MSPERQVLEKLAVDFQTLLRVHGHSENLIGISRERVERWLDLIAEATTNE